MEKNPLVSVENISVRLRDKVYLNNISWKIGRGEQWAILGPNGSGKTTLAKALFGQVPVIHGEVKIFHSDHEGAHESADSCPVQYVSPDEYRTLIQRSILEDSFRHFSGRVTDFTSAKSILLEVFNQQKAGMRGDEKALDVARRMGIENLLERPVEALSIGESRKLLIARALIREPRLLILDKPFDGLDRDSRRSLGSIIEELIKHGISILLITNRIEEIVEPITHVLVMQNGGILASGKKADILGDGNLADLRPVDSGNMEVDADLYHTIEEISKEKRSEAGEEASFFSETLVEMKNVTVKYDGLVVIDHLNWSVRRGENWAILGPNGAGKSTLLKLILGDNQQAYGNDIILFGQKKGAGATIWELKRHIGVVSADLQARYKAETKVTDVVCSGFHDSVGLYRHCNYSERELANSWLRLTGLEDSANKRFDQLSYGQRQLALVARAMVKNPQLLILDEPCDGLDYRNRARLLRLMKLIGDKANSTLLITTHREDEIPACVQKVLLLRKGKVIGIRKRTAEFASPAAKTCGQIPSQGR
jgi:molybdate transport system ATP-binding protein